MIRSFANRARLAIALTLVFAMIVPFSGTAWSQTPEQAPPPPVETEAPAPPPPPPVETEAPAPPPPPPVETEVPTVVETEVPPVETVTEVVPPEETATEVSVHPVETEVPVEPTETEVPVEPTETELPVAPTETDVPAEPTETEAATESPTVEPTPTAEGTPTPTEEVIEPDQLVVVGNAALTVVPGQYQDFTTRYTLGSDRNKTELTANIVAPGGESMEGWVLTPIDRGDALEDPADPNRAYKARVDVADVTNRQDTFDVTWRLTAPEHVETPIALRIDFSATTHRDDGVTDGATQVNLVSTTGTASVHTPTLTCDVAEAANTWNCALATTHPDNEVVVTAKAVVPDGWDLKVNSALELSDIAAPLDATVVAAGAFTLNADYPIGCPDKSASSVATLGLDLTYPSGEVLVVESHFAIEFERPSPKLTVNDFSFGNVEDPESLDTTGELTIEYSDAPCGWQASIEFSELTSDAYTVDDALIEVVKVDGLDGATVTFIDNRISILVPEGKSELASDEFTIHLRLVLPHLIPPGTYVINVVTQFGRLDES